MTKKSENGRIVYVEPNNWALRDNTIVEFNDNCTIPHPYEDYSIAVELDVVIGDRLSCGIGSGTTISFSAERGTISFMGDGKSILTTSYTDISMTDPSSNTKECLGIESINIMYDSWMYPQVTIKFVDIRGASLFLPTEQSYYNKEDIIESTASNFYRTLFMFPHPMFKLRVKGFYGNPIVYNLSVADFKAEFDATKGNFIATVQFIGYMFGLYNDIPFNLLAIAPFTNTGKRYWETNKDNGLFRYNDGDGLPMLTYPEYRTKMSTYSKFYDEALKKEDTYKRKQINENIQTLINEIRENFPLIIGVWYEGQNGEYYTISASKEYKIDETLVKTFKNKINEYNNKNGNNKLNINTETLSFNPITMVRYEIKNGRYFFNIINNGFYDNGSTISPNSNEYIFERYPKIKDEYNTEGYIISCKFPTDFIKSLNERIESLQQEVVLIEDEVNKLKNGIISNLLGFNPTIKNVFDMGFAHMDTFMELFYSYLKEINNEIKSNNENRNLETYGININDTDIKTKSTKKVIPPFPRITKQDTIGGKGIVKKDIWPGSLKNGEKLKEVQLVMELINASNLYNDEIKRSEEIIQTIGKAKAPSSTIENFIPITPYDLINKDKMTNPYDCILKEYMSDYNVGKYISFIFIVRAYAFFSAYGTNESRESINKVAKMFANIEAMNLAKAVTNEDATQYFINNFINNDKLYDDIINKEDDIWFRGDNTKTKTRKKLFANGKYPYFNWLTYDDKEYGSFPLKFLPVGEFNLKNISNDVNLNEIVSNGKYLNLGHDIHNTVDEFCVIFDDYEYLDNLYTNLNLYVEGSEDNEMPNRFLKKYSKLIEGEKSNHNINRLYNLHGNRGHYMGISKYVDDTEILEANLGKEYFNYIKKANENIDDTLCAYAPSVIEEVKVFRGTLSYEYNIFGNEIMYRSDLSIEEKAYYFIMGFHYNMEENMNSKYATPSMVVPRIHLLKEGAFYWRCEKMHFYNVEEELKSLDMDYNLFEPDFINKFFARKKVLINYFKEWVRNTFITLIYPEMAISLNDNGNIRYLNENDFNLFNRDNINEIKNNFTNRFYDYNLKYDIKNVHGYKHITNLRISGKKYKNNDESDIQNQLDFNKLNNELLSIMLDECTIIDVHQTSAGTTMKHVHKLMRKSFNKFKELVKEKYNAAVNAIESNIIPLTINETPYKNDDLCLSLYLTLKNLYDKWICAGNREKFKISNKDSDFKQFKYIDTFFHDIGQNILVNPSHVSEIIDSSLPTIVDGVEIETTKYNGSSLYEYLSLICQKTKMVLMPLPAYFGMTRKMDIADMFDAKPFIEVDMDGYDTSTYLCLYTYQPSTHLDVSDNGDYMYNNDGFDIANTWGDVGDLPLSLMDNHYGEYTIPSFGVTFAKQNQSYFKNIKLNMNNHQITDYSIAATMEIAANNSINGDRQTTLYGQDLYSIFSNYSYTCDVEALGNAQILPTMYFQLNNIPMWKGAYMITKVEHNINNGNMTTNFSGVRLNKHAIPFTDGEAIFLREPETNIENTFSPIKPSENSILENISNASINTMMDYIDMGNYLYNVYYGGKSYDYNERNNREICTLYGNMMKKVLPKFGIVMDYQIAMFVAQIGHESNCLKYTTELGNDSYFDKYEGRTDLGNIYKGDGLKYKGRGLIQITGRNNYQKFSDYMSKNFGFTTDYFINNFEQVAEPENALLSACWFWDINNLNSIASDINNVTQKINGGKTHLRQRQILYDKALYEIRNYREFN